LVCPGANPAWKPEFRIVIGVIMDRGGLIVGKLKKPKEEIIKKAGELGVEYEKK
jgi:hypothetical protein